MRLALALRHVPFEDLGTLGPLLESRQFEVRYVDIGVDDLSVQDAARADLVVVLGGPIGAGDEAVYPYLVDEIAVITERLVSKRPILGICLGAQLMARALGATVAPMAEGKEIGYGQLTLTGEGRSSVLDSLRDISVLHWHGDAFALPEGAVRLASTDQCPNQAFIYQRHALGLQFHLEVDVTKIEQWLIGHSMELSASGVSVEQIRLDSKRFGGQLAEAAQTVFGRWLDDIE